MNIVGSLSSIVSIGHQGGKEDHRGGEGNNNEYEDNDDTIGSAVLILIGQIYLHPLTPISPPRFLAIGNMPAEGILPECGYGGERVKWKEAKEIKERIANYKRNVIIQKTILSSTSPFLDCFFLVLEYSLPHQLLTLIISYLHYTVKDHVLNSYLRIIHIHTKICIEGRRKPVIANKRRVRDLYAHKHTVIQVQT